MYEMPYRYDIDDRGRTYSPVLGRMVELSRPMRYAVDLLNSNGFVDGTDRVTVGTFVALMDRGILREATPRSHGRGSGHHYPAHRPDQVWDEAHAMNDMCCTLNPLGHGRDECPASRAVEVSDELVELPAFGATVHFVHEGRMVSGEVRSTVTGGGEPARVVLFSRDLGHTHRIDHGVTIRVADLVAVRVPVRATFEGREVSQHTCGAVKYFDETPDACSWCYKPGTWVPLYTLGGAK